MKMKQKNKKSTSRFQTANVSKLMPVSKRSQHEIAGFVLIVVLVSIIGIIFLGL